MNSILALHIYSWDYGGVHFVQFISEKHFLRPDAIKRQELWLEADLKSVPKGMPVIIATHYPLTTDWFDRWKAEGINIICQLAGHRHEVQLGSRGNVPIIISAPARGKDSGAYSRAYAWIHVGKKGIKTDIRIAGQYERLEVCSPGNETVPGKQPMLILAYDSSKKSQKS